jgi:FkbH-like protein
MIETLRDSVDAAISQQQWGAAWTQLKQLYEEVPSIATAQFVLDRLGKLPLRVRPIPCRLAMLRSFTLESVVPLLRVAALLNGIDLTVQLGDFNTYPQDILNPSSQLYTFDPQIVLLAVQTRDVAPDLWNRFPQLSSQQVEDEVKRVAGDFRSWIEAFRSHHSASLIIHNLESPALPNAGILDEQVEPSQVEAIRRINCALRRAARENPGVYVLDYDGLVARYGRTRWHDERKWLTMRMPIAAEGLIHLANEYLRYLLPTLGLTCKALVMDLDNTLWGGIVGEDGLQGIKVGAEYPGAAFLALQRVILHLYQRGIILAICSKNNPEEALQALREHPGMLLRPQHFAALRIDWEDKSKNLREIAGELNIGTDALAFLDDNPVERERVRAEMPEVFVIDLPADPMDYACALQQCPVFERLTLAEEDRDRGRYYAQERERKELQQSATSLEDFYRSLCMEVQISPVDATSLARVAQLTQKTNQFNLTTRRYTEQQISALSKDPHWRVYSLRLRDRFGDNGLVGVAMTERKGGVVEIDNFLLSCRVIGREVETALLAHLAEVSLTEGAKNLRGSYIPTKKNAPAKDFYPSHGFKLAAQDGEITTWDLDLCGEGISCPDWVKCTAGDRINV